MGNLIMKPNKIATTAVTLLASATMLASCGENNVKPANYTTKTSEVVKTNSKAVKAIKEKVDKISAEKDVNKKLDMLKDMIADSEKAAKDKKTTSDVTKAYDEGKAKICKEFKDANNKSIEDNTIKDLNAANVEDLTSKAESLKTTKANVEKQGTTVYTEKELNDIKSKIDGLVKSYEDKINEKNEAAKKEAEAQQAEQAAQAEAEAQQAATQQAVIQQAAAQQAAPAYKAPAAQGGSGYAGQASAAPQYQAPARPQYQAPAQPQYQAPAAPQAPAQNQNPNRDYGTSWGTGSGQDNWTQNNQNGSWSAGVGNGTNDEELGGWIIGQ